MDIFIKTKKQKPVYHELKISQFWYEQKKIGVKPWEIRLYDRKFEVGDVLILKEIDENNEYTGRSIYQTVESVYELKEYIRDGFVILSGKISVEGYDVQ